ncbi:hypothetical protein [Rhizobium bangladeshense]|uniref:hypothetical protein n=1 Tax=Rhizobium bangladeshense TaxID=1138189 RepID=UPI003D7C18AE
MRNAEITNDRPRLPGSANEPSIRKISPVRRARHPDECYTGCPNCGRALSIAEVIERHCENCGRQTKPEEIRRTPIVARSASVTESDSLTPP